MKFHLGWDQVLVGQQLQLPHPTSLHQLEGDVLRVGAQPAEHFIHTMSTFFKVIEEMHKKTAVDKKRFLLLLDIRKLP